MGLQNREAQQQFRHAGPQQRQSYAPAGKRNGLLDTALKLNNPFETFLNYEQQLHHPRFIRCPPPRYKRTA
jgi:hypothetical protein